MTAKGSGLPGEARPLHFSSLAELTPNSPRTPNNGGNVEKQFKVIRGSIRIPRPAKKDRKSKLLVLNHSDYLHQGDIVPDGVFSDASLRSLEAAGRISLVSQRETVEGPAREALKIRGKWGVDPSSLLDKSEADMRLMVIDIDPSYQGADKMAKIELFRLLTSQWSPDFAAPIAKASDKAEVIRFNPDKGVKAGAERDLSDRAQSALERARAKARVQSESADETAEPISGRAETAVLDVAEGDEG